MNRSTEIPAKNGIKPWEFDGFEYENGAFNYDISKPYRLWFEYLRRSPTYLLAHKHKTAYKGGLTEAQKNRYIDILSKDQLGQFRQTAKNGTGLEGKKLGQQIAEHNPPIEKQKAIIKEYVNNKSDISKAEIEEYLDQLEFTFYLKKLQIYCLKKIYLANQDTKILVF